MKNTLVFFVCLSSIYLSACSGPTVSKDTTAATKDTTTIAADTSSTEQVKLQTAQFAHLELPVSNDRKTLIENYLAIKNALFNSNALQAAAAAGALLQSVQAFHKSALTAEQKKVFESIEPALMANATSMKTQKIDEQRISFAAMSKDMYGFVKSFGAGRTIYLDHCPMFKDGSGWLSETKTISNPFYGEKMPDCGSVEEMFQ
jgi:hypothetical protein